MAENKFTWGDKCDQLSEAGYKFVGWENDAEFVKPEYEPDNLDTWTDGAGHTLWWDFTTMLFWACDSSD